MVTKKTAPPVAITPSAPSALTVAAASAPVAPTTPAKLPARKRAATTRPAVKKMPIKQDAPSSLPEKAAPAEKMLPAKKIKMVRDSFTMPKAEYAALDELKQRTIRLDRPLKKSELLRIGIKLLAALPDARLLAALTELPSLKSGQPTLDKQTASIP